MPFDVYQPSSYYSFDKCQSLDRRHCRYSRQFQERPVSGSDSHIFASFQRKHSDVRVQSFEETLCPRGLQKRKGFAHMEHEELVHIIAARDAFDDFCKRSLMNHRDDLTKSQVDVLIGLKFAGKMSMTQVSEHLAVSKEQATRATAPLVQRGFVKRERHKDNYRVVEVSLTDEGEQRLADGLAIVLREINGNLRSISDEDRAQLVEASRTAVEILRKTKQVGL